MDQKVWIVQKPSMLPNTSMEPMNVAEAPKVDSDPDVFALRSSSRRGRPVGAVPWAFPEGLVRSRSGKGRTERPKLSMLPNLPGEVQKD